MRACETLGHSESLAPCRRFRSSQAAHRHIKCRRCIRQAAKGVDIEDRGQASEEAKQAASKSGQEMYIGFDKSDSQPRAGRKGRVVTDDPSRYPDRDSLSGGWAGGEVGLRQFIEEEDGQGMRLEKAKVIESKDKGRKVKAVTADGEEIYLGYSKEDLDVRKSGRRGRSIRDDPRKYPGKEDLGIFSGITGGFAGGEKGVQQFVEKGEVKLAEKEQREFSPILFAALLAGGVTAGAILLNSGVVISEQAVTGVLRSGTLAGQEGGSSGSSGIAIDDNTRLLLNLALGLGGLGSLVIGTRAISRRLQNSTVQLKEDAVNVGKIAVFWLLVLVAALYIVDSQ